MKVTDVVALVWGNPEHTILTGMVVTSDIGTVPICINANYDTEYGQQLWNDAIAGRYGPILEYKEPPINPGPISDEISRRQFFQYLAVLGIITRQEALAALQNGVIPAPLQAIVDQLPTENDQFDAQMFIIGAQNFNRLHWLTDKVRLAMQWTLDQRDDFWREAYKI